MLQWKEKNIPVAANALSVSARVQDLKKSSKVLYLSVLNCKWVFEYVIPHLFKIYFMLKHWESLMAFISF